MQYRTILYGPCTNDVLHALDAVPQGAGSYLTGLSEEVAVLCFPIPSEFRGKQPLEVPWAEHPPLAASEPAMGQSHDFATQRPASGLGQSVMHGAVNRDITSRLAPLTIPCIWMLQLVPCRRQSDGGEAQAAQTGRPW